jgi:hypothetical protein
MIGFLVRVIIRLLLRSRFGYWFLGGLGIVVILIGLLVGTSSHQVTYSQISNATLSHYLAQTDGSDDTAYLQTSDGTLYTLHQNDFTPTLSSDKITSRTISFVYNPTDTTSVDESSTNTSTHLQGDAYTIVQLTISDQNGNRQPFTSKDYAANPQGFYENKWVGGTIAIIVGLLVLALAIFLIYRKRKNRLAASANGMNAVGSNQPYGAPPVYQVPGTPQYNPNQAGTPNPYQQPYSGTESYQPYQQDPTMPAQPPQGNYPPNPYHPQTLQD